jgi:hypothetical protein
VLLLTAGEPPVPSQPSRIPVLVLKEIASQLNRIGIDLLTNEFVNLTATLCLESIAQSYSEIPLEISADAATQIFTDMTFFMIAFSGRDHDTLNAAREKFREKVLLPSAFLTSSVPRE